MKKISNPIIKAHLKGTLWSVAITFGAILVFAFFVQIAGMSDRVVRPIVQVVKALSIFIGVMMVIRAVEKRAWLHGGILGLVYTCLTFLALGIIDSSFSTAGGFFIEAIFAIAIGLLSAMLLRLRKRNI